MARGRSTEIISMIMCSRTSRLSINNSFSLNPETSNPKPRTLNRKPDLEFLDRGVSEGPQTPNPKPQTLSPKTDLEFLDGGVPERAARIRERRGHGGHAHVTPRPWKDVLQKSIPAQVRQLILYYYYDKR